MEIFLKGLFLLMLLYVLYKAGAFDLIVSCFATIFSIIITIVVVLGILALIAFIGIIAFPIILFLLAISLIIMWNENRKDKKKGI